jgi:DNA ligase (NAD+)
MNEEAPHMESIYLDNLIKEILRHKQLYYQGKPEISDEEYDKLEEELRGFDPNSPILKLVGSITKGKIIHDPPMLSCEKLKTIQKANRWAGKNILIWGHKIDGISIKLVYINGILVQGSTRGDGIHGEDITEHCKNIENIPKKIKYKGYLEVRGEGYIPLSIFIEIKGEYKSARNLASGTMMSKDPELVKERHVHFMAWNLINPQKNYDVDKKISFLVRLGFQTADHGKIFPRGLENVYNYVSKSREELDFELDGVVFKVNSHDVQEEMGSTDHHPRWMIALKFESKEFETTIKRISWQMSQSGVYTPVGIYDPVEVPGATLKRVQLFNAKNVLDNKLQVGTKIMVIRSGDIIPKYTQIIDTPDDPPNIIKHCKYCKKELEVVGVNICCVNNDCNGRRFMYIEHFVDMAKVKHLSRKSLLKLWKAKEIRETADLFKLDEETYVDILGKNGWKIYNRIDEMREMKYEVFLYSIGVEGLSKVTAKKIAKDGVPIEEITVEYLMSKERVGEAQATKVCNGLKNNKKMIDALLEVLDIEIKERVKIETNVLEGKRIYVSGSVEGYNKDQLEDLIVKHGGTWSSGVSKPETRILVLGKNPGPSKIDKATDREIKMMSWQKFKELIDE